MGRRAARRRVKRRQEEYFTTSDRSRSCGHTKARRQENTQTQEPPRQTTKVPGAVCWTLFWKLQRDESGSSRSQRPIRWPHLTICLRAAKKKKKALKWPHCIYSCCLAILHIFYATAGENYSTGRRPRGFERTSQI